MTFPHTLQERKGPFACPRCGAPIHFLDFGTESTYLEHDDSFEGRCAWLDEATDEQVEALK